MYALQKTENGISSIPGFLLDAHLRCLASSSLPSRPPAVRSRVRHQLASALRRSSYGNQGIDVSGSAVNRFLLPQSRGWGWLFLERCERESRNVSDVCERSSGLVSQVGGRRKWWSLTSVCRWQEFGLAQAGVSRSLGVLMAA